MAGGKSQAFDTDLLKLILNGTPIAGIADNAASAPLAQLYLSLHTADPGAGGSQSANEAVYPNYVRIPVARTTAGFMVSGTAAVLTSTMNFAVAGTMVSSEIETWAAVGTAATGNGKIIYRGPITPNITVTTGVGPQLAAGSQITES